MKACAISIKAGDSSGIFILIRDMAIGQRSIGASPPALRLLSRGHGSLAHKIVARPVGFADRAQLGLLHPKEVTDAVVMESSRTIMVTAPLTLLLVWVRPRSVSNRSIKSALPQ